MDTMLNMNNIAPIIFIFVMFVFWGFTFTTFYHLTRFGVGIQPKKIAASFLLGSVLLFSISTILLGSVNIDSLKTLFESIQLNNLSGQNNQ
jgi:hypothetical protein